MSIMASKLQSCRNVPTEVWALMGGGAMAALVTMDMTSVCDFEGIIPKFADLNGAVDIEALHALTG